MNAVTATTGMCCVSLSFLIWWMTSTPLIFGIAKSVKKTTRALVAYEDNRSFGYGAEIASRISEELFEFLDAPVRRLLALVLWRLWRIVVTDVAESRRLASLLLIMLVGMLTLGVFDPIATSLNFFTVVALGTAFVALHEQASASETARP